MLLTLSWITDLSFFITLLVFVFYKYAKRNFGYWKMRGVPFEEPTPFLGNLGDLLFLRHNIGVWMKRLYESVPNVPYLGVFAFDEPILLIRSPDIIKKILIKDFVNFNNRPAAIAHHNEIEKELLFSLENKHWKKMRSKLSPVFSTSRLKNIMLNIMLNISEDMRTYVGENLGDLNIKNISSRYAVDVLARYTFGIKANSFKEDGSEFLRIVTKNNEIHLRDTFAQIVFAFKQKWVNYFKINFFEYFMEKYMVNIVLEMLDLRKGKVSTANDLIDIINELRQSESFKKDFDFVGLKIATQPLQLFVAGLETISSTISFTLYELCMNPNLQQRLRMEILANMETQGDLITWAGIHEMKYLDMCVAETLRMYPTLPFLERKCNANYVIPETDLVIEKGMRVYIPMLGLHFDEKYYPDSHKYDPERFANGIPNDSGSIYLPFGDGPRNCIGKRFGVLASKLALCQLISRYEFIRNDETPASIEFSARTMNLTAKGGISVRVKRYKYK